MSHIFISYSRKDSACVDQIVNRLKADDLPVWLDRREIAVSANWTKEIVKGIDSAAVFLLLWSANAQQSPYVGQEMEIALNRSFGTHKHLKIVVVPLDATPPPDVFSHKQAFMGLKNGCSDHGISDLLAALPPDLRVFAYDKPLGQQRPLLIPDTPLVRVAFDREPGWGFKADLVGSADQRFPKAPDLLHVGLQFTRGTSLNLVEDVYKAMTPPAQPFWMLHVMGTTNDAGTEYRLDPERDLWEASCSYIQESIKRVADERKTTLRVFAPIPAALLAGAMRGFERFWHVQLYHYEPTLKNYFLALDQQRR